jgi:hypothetical protein
VGSAPVDFTDEELAQPAGARARRLRVDIAVGALLLGGALLVARALEHHEHGRHAAAIVRVTDAPPPTTTPDALELEAAPTCPRATDGEDACSTARSVPAGFLAAVHGLLPHAVVDRAESNVIRPTGPERGHGIWSRTFAAHDGARRIVIVVSDGLPAGDGATQTHGRPDAVTYVRTAQGPYTVQVQVSAPERLAPAFGDITELAADARLVRRG